MKQLTCEMCGSTDLVKDGGVFVCQTCGTKYSVEEAKKMMIEGTVQITGDVEIKNAAKLENLLNLALNAYKSDNFLQAETFCDQVLAMDSINHEAWELKGKAISSQQISKNSRALEAHNCIMTSYELLSDDNKEEKKLETFSLLLTCIFGAIRFELNEFKTKKSITINDFKRIKESYVDSCKNVKDDFDKFKLKKNIYCEYLNDFNNNFITLMYEDISSAWENVALRYYGDDKYGYNWIRDQACVNQNLSRTPDKKDCDDFIIETSILIGLLQYAEKCFNDKTPLEIKSNIYEKMLKLMNCIKDSGYFTSGYGYLSPSMVYKSGYRDDMFGYVFHSSINFNLALIREKLRFGSEEIKLYNRKLEKLEKQSEEERIKTYWENHKEEKNSLEKEKKLLENEKKEYDNKILELETQKEKVPSISLLEKTKKEIKNLESEKKNMGLFKIKEKNLCTKKIEELNNEITKLERAVKTEQKKLENEMESIKTNLNKAVLRIKEIKTELTRDRSEEDEVDEEDTE